MKKISDYTQTIRENNSAYFILEKYNTEIAESITKAAIIIENEAAKVNLSPAEYSEVLAKLYKK